MTLKRHTGRLKKGDFNKILLKIASPEDILSWSHGEIKIPETINYRTQKAVRDGLFCNKIFGPDIDYQCSCGKWKGIQYNGITCSECGVDITKSSIRRERMGHIELAAPMSHIWYLAKIPSIFAQLLGVPAQNLQKIIYHSSYLITQINVGGLKKHLKELEEKYKAQVAEIKNKKTKDEITKGYKEKIKNVKYLKENESIDEDIYISLLNNFPGLFEVDRGADAIYNLFKELDLKKIEKQLIKELETATETKKEKLNKQLRVVRWFLKSNTKPEWMFFTKLPVLPPGLRPLIQLPTGQYANSDLNDLYRLIIIRNNKLKEFLQNNSPKIFIETQKRLVQEAVDALLDASIRGTQKTTVSVYKKKLKSIAEYLPHKRGFFRGNLLGKRVDYSGRSVIVVGPHLKLNECGLPKDMALQLFKPFIVHELIKSEETYNLKGASSLIEDKTEAVWEALDRAIKDKYVLLNRAPTLHKQNLLAYKPRLIEGRAIEIGPLICKAYNADFDGDAMTIHVPLSEEALAEAKNILISTKNTINPGTGEVNMSPVSQDILLGCYWATQMEEVDKKTEERYSFGSVSEAITAYDFGWISIRTPVRVLVSDKPRYRNSDKVLKTTIGRLCFNNLLPDDKLFINETITKKLLNQISSELIAEYDSVTATGHFDTIKDFGFKQASLSGITYAWSDLLVSDKRDDILRVGFGRVNKIQDNFSDGFISAKERIRMSVEVWNDVKKQMIEEAKKTLPVNSSLSDMILSGARGDFQNLTNVVGMVGVIDASKAEFTEQAIFASLKKGLNPIEYFYFAFGGRKTLIDGSLLTAEAGYLTRKLFSAAQDVNVVEKDCGTSKGFTLYRNPPLAGVISPFNERVQGRILASDIKGKKVSMVKNKLIDYESAKTIEADESIESIRVRSPITCTTLNGICAKCYGHDRTKNEMVDLGEAVGTIAAQSVGEPGTQLTMRTFHTGGSAALGGNITDGLPRVIEIFNNTTPKILAILSMVDGVVSNIDKTELGNPIVVITPDTKSSKGEVEYQIPKTSTILVKKGDKVHRGQFLTDGSADLKDMLKYSGIERTREYIFEEIDGMYSKQGIHLIPVHFEILIKQMFSRSKIIDGGDSDYIKGETIENKNLIKMNKELKNQGKKVIKAELTVTGIPAVAVSKDSFLSAAAFQNTTSVLIKSAVQGAEDDLDGLVENVIIGDLIPVGTGFKGSKKYKMMESVIEDVRSRIADKLQREHQERLEKEEENQN